MSSTHISDSAPIAVPSRPRDEREGIGQFFTPFKTAELLASSFSPLESAAEIRLLDSGAGAGVLTSSFIDWVLLQPKKPSSVSVTTVEFDEQVIPLLQATLDSCAKRMEAGGIKFTADIHNLDFVRLASDQIELGQVKTLRADFTHAILNPPYKKIATDSEERKLLSKVGIEVSNIYAGFVALAVKLLQENGELVAITPRSFCNGPYFKPFRELLVNSTVFRSFHVVASRDKAFAHDAVLQENIVFSIQKTQTKPSCVQICTSDRATRINEVCHEVPYSTVVSPSDTDLVLHLPVDQDGINAMDTITSMPQALSDLGIQVSTGPVVDFRLKEYLKADLVEGAVPLIFPTHFTKGGVEWPKDGKKPNAIYVHEDSMPYLVKRGTYVLVKRFSSKEEKKRITARVLEGEDFLQESIGLENHLNYYHQKGKPLDTDFAFGLAAYLNWSVVDTYFRQFNGHTQVNASDLRMLRYPKAETLCKIGADVRKQADRFEQSTLDCLLSRSLS
jgi:adenine-specific DNA-methyltransferase